MESLNKKLPAKLFVIFVILTLSLGFIFLGFLYYFLNFRFQAPTVYSQLAGPITSAPKSLRIDLDSPDDDTLSLDKEIIVSGKTSPGQQVLIMTDSLSLIVKAKTDGSFSTLISLDDGVNKITAVAFDSKGDNRFSERTVCYSKEKI